MLTNLQVFSKYVLCAHSAKLFDFIILKTGLIIIIPYSGRENHFKTHNTKTESGVQVTVYRYKFL